MNIHNQSVIWWAAAAICGVFALITLWLSHKARAAELVEQRMDDTKDSRQQALQALLKNQQQESWWSNITQAWQRDLLQAGFIDVHAWKVFGLSKISLAIVVGSCVWLFAENNALMLVIAIAFVANLLPDFWLSHRKKVQRQAINKALPSHLALIIVCLRAGYSIDRALALVAQELQATSPVLSRQWQITLEQLAINPDRQVVWLALAERVNIDNFTSLVELLQQSERYGSAIAQTLATFTQQMRESQQLAIEEKIGKVASRITLPMLLLIFLPLMVIMLAPQLAMLMDALKGLQ